MSSRGGTPEFLDEVVAFRCVVISIPNNTTTHPDTTVEETISDDTVYKATKIRRGVDLPEQTQEHMCVVMSSWMIGSTPMNERGEVLVKLK